LQEPSYVLHSSPNRVHVFWRVTGFEPDYVEALQQQLARELETDPVATPATQATRLVGYSNHKYQPAHLVTIDYRCIDRVYPPTDFPYAARVTGGSTTSTVAPPPSQRDPRMFYRGTRGVDPVERARLYLARVPPAVAGEHGDVHTFRVCCRLVRGFALTDDEALDVLTEWNVRCQPPWTKSDLDDKLRRARRYGREPMAALLRS
jgi:hypothetical protein